MLVWLVRRFEPSADLPSEVIDMTTFAVCFVAFAVFDRHDYIYSLFAFFVAFGSF